MSPMSAFSKPFQLHDIVGEKEVKHKLSEGDLKRHEFLYVWEWRQSERVVSVKEFGIVRATVSTVQNCD